MTPAEVSQVLAAAAMRDNRTVGPADVLAWLQDIGDLDPADALAAVSVHYREHTERLMPAHVRRIVAETNRRRGEVERSEQLRRELEALDAVAAEPARDRSPQVRAMLEELARRLGPGRPEALRRPEWLENDRARERAAQAQPNPAYAGPPPQGGWPLPETENIVPLTSAERAEQYLRVGRERQAGLDHDRITAARARINATEETDHA